MSDILLYLLPFVLCAMVLLFFLIKRGRDMRADSEEQPFFEEMTEYYSENGVDTVLADKLCEHIAESGTKNQNAVINNFYCRWLAIYNISVCDYEGALCMLKNENEKASEKLRETTGSGWFLCEHHVYRIIAAARMGDLDLLETYYSKAKAVFQDYLSTENNKSYLINEAMIMREIAHGRFDKAEQMIRPMFSVENAEIHAAANMMMGRCAFGRGDAAKGNKYFDKAKALTTSEFKLQSLELKRHELITRTERGY